MSNSKHISLAPAAEPAPEMPRKRGVQDLAVLNAQRSTAIMHFTGRMIDITMIPTTPSGPACRCHIELSLPHGKPLDIGQPRIKPVLCVYGVRNANKLFRAAKAKKNHIFSTLHDFPAKPLYFAPGERPGEKWENGWLVSWICDMTAYQTHTHGYMGGAQKRADDDRIAEQQEKELEEEYLW
jgi:hypothetical protein